jgi:hypothetical protein
MHDIDGTKGDRLPTSIARQPWIALSTGAGGQGPQPKTWAHFRVEQTELINSTTVLHRSGGQGNAAAARCAITLLPKARGPLEPVDGREIDMINCHTADTSNHAFLSTLYMYTHVLTVKLI